AWYQVPFAHIGVADAYLGVAVSVAGCISPIIGVVTANHVASAPLVGGLVVAPAAVPRTASASRVHSASLWRRGPCDRAERAGSQAREDRAGRAEERARRFCARPGGPRRARARARGRGAREGVLLRRRGDPARRRRAAAAHRGAQAPGARSHLHPARA